MEKLILTESEVRKIVGMSRTTLWRMRLDGRFPKPLDMGTRSVRYRRADIESWVAGGAMAFEGAA